MKKTYSCLLLAIMLCALFTVCLTACNGADTDETVPAPTEPQATESDDPGTQEHVCVRNVKTVIVINDIKKGSKIDEDDVEYGYICAHEQTEEHLPMLIYAVNKYALTDLDAGSEVLSSDISLEHPITNSPAHQLGYVVVTDYIEADEDGDVSDILQSIIDENPNRTIYFPDGTYMLSKPIYTPAEPTKSVSLELSNYAIIKASSSWDNSLGAMIQLGGKDAANNTATPGSNYYLDGGIIDGSGVADAISIESGRETAVRNTSIKNVRVGISIPWGANSGSADADVYNVNIIGNRTTESIGIVISSYDNTLTNIRIGGIHTGVILTGGGNMLRNVHPLCGIPYGNGYKTTKGFVDSGNNRFDYCYSDQFATGFTLTGNAKSIYDNCYCYWWTDAGGVETAFRAEGKFRSVVTNFRADFHTTTKNAVLIVGQSGGQGIFDNLSIYTTRPMVDYSYEDYLEGRVIPLEND